jgi:hypothetical protein
MMINPNNIKWVQNTRTKPFADELDVIAVKRKCDYPDVGTIVKLTNIMSKFPNAEIRFKSGFKSLLPYKYAEGLCYLHGQDGGNYVWDNNTGRSNYVPNPNPPPYEEAYQHTITNTYGMTNEGLVELTETMLHIKKVLIDKILQQV